MEPRTYLHNSKFDLAIRNHGFWPYFVCYGLLFLFAFAATLPAPVNIPLMAHQGRIAAASTWAFVGSYPLFHVLMKARLYQNYSQPARRFGVAAVGSILVAVILYFLSFSFPHEPTTRAGRILANPAGAVLFLAGASCTVSLGLFLVLEPVRSRISRGL